MKLREEEFYEQYHHHGGTTIIPTEIFNELYDDAIEEIDRLNKENNDLRKLYQRTYKHLFEIGNDELARYFQAQIDECRTFYVEPIIDYYEETKRLNSIIKGVREYIEKDTRWFDSEYAKTYGELCTCAGANNTRLEVLVNPSNLLEILDKENNNA